MDTWVVLLHSAFWQQQQWLWDPPPQAQSLVCIHLALEHHFLLSDSLAVFWHPGGPPGSLSQGCWPVWLVPSAIPSSLSRLTEECSVPRATPEQTHPALCLLLPSHWGDSEKGRNYYTDTKAKMSSAQRWVPVLAELHCSLCKAMICTSCHWKHLSILNRNSWEMFACQ